MSGPIACKECRQQKVRCLGRELNHGTCERCAKRSIECVIDNNYKRLPKRKAIEGLEAEIEDLKRQLSELRNRQPEPPAKKQKSVELPPARFSAGSTRPTTVPSLHVATFYSPPRSALDSTLEEITLTPEVIEVLFSEYVAKYHHVLPVVEVQHGPEFIHNASPALFWTIMAIASRRKSDELPPNIGFDKLSSVQKRLLSEIAVSPVLGHGLSAEFNLPSVYAVQAFLLCTLWPPPTASINADMSWNASGIACLTAVRAGLHCPGHASDFERIFKSNKTHRANIREQLVTWVATNALTQAIANMFGYPSAATFYLHTRYPYQNIDLPPRVRHMYELQRVAHEIEQSLGRLTPDLSLDQATASSLIRLHAARYDEIEAQYATDMDSWTLFTLHAGRAQLFAYYLFGKVETEGIMALYYSCLTLLDYVVAQDDDYVKYLPVVSILILWQTASVVARLWHSRWSMHLDKATGERLYREAVQKVQLASVFKHDLPYRAAEIMTQMWAAFSAMRRDNHHKAVSATLTLKSRMSASVFFDSLYAMREQCEIHSQAPTTLSSSNRIAGGTERWRVSSIEALLSPEPSAVSPASIASASDLDTRTPWQDVNSVMEDFGFGLGELPYLGDDI